MVNTGTPTASFRLGFGAFEYLLTVVQEQTRTDCFLVFWIERRTDTLKSVVNSTPTQSSWRPGDALDGEGGNGAGSNFIEGGAGRDTLDYTNVKYGITVEMAGVGSRALLQTGTVASVVTLTSASAISRTTAAASGRCAHDRPAQWKPDRNPDNEMSQDDRKIDPAPAFSEESVNGDGRADFTTQMLAVRGPVRVTIQ
ncbi:MAG: hypothetical protein KJ587_02145 [Alphaproteobacteria bacterium]|nr:hypothetical protein [Alphaproteobacteria bacterium]